MPPVCCWRDVSVCSASPGFLLEVRPVLLNSLGEAFHHFQFTLLRLYTTAAESMFVKMLPFRLPRSIAVITVRFLTLTTYAASPIMIRDSLPPFLATFSTAPDNFFLSSSVRVMPLALSLSWACWENLTSWPGSFSSNIFAKEELLFDVADSPVFPGAVVCFGRICNGC